MQRLTLIDELTDYRIESCMRRVRSDGLLALHSLRHQLPYPLQEQLLDSRWNYKANVLRQAKLNHRSPIKGKRE
jgi:hypothetical protein